MEQAKDIEKKKAEIKQQSIASSNKFKVVALGISMCTIVFCIIQLSLIEEINFNTSLATIGGSYFFAIVGMVTAYLTGRVVEKIKRGM